MFIGVDPMDDTSGVTKNLKSVDTASPLGDIVEEELVKRNLGDSIAYIRYGGQFADHSYIIERRSLDGKYRVYQSWVDNYLLKAWLSGQDDVLETTGNSGSIDLLAFAKSKYGEGQWFDPNDVETPFLEKLNVWYMGTRSINKEDKKTDIADDAKTALQDLHGIIYQDPLPMKKGENTVHILTYDAPLNHKCDAGVQALADFDAKVADADCQFCVAMLGILVSDNLPKRMMEKYCDERGDVDPTACHTFGAQAPFRNKEEASNYIRLNMFSCTSNTACCVHMEYCTPDMVPTNLFHVGASEYGPYGKTGEIFVQANSRIKKRIRPHIRRNV
jgi:hypothetical protein